jgi:hypothetical protein
MEFAGAVEFKLDFNEMKMFQNGERLSSLSKSKQK